MILVERAVLHVPYIPYLPYLGKKIQSNPYLVYWKNDVRRNHPARYSYNEVDEERGILVHCKPMIEINLECRN